MAVSEAAFRNIARRYVTALFALAEEQGKTAEIAEDLAVIATAIADSAELERFINNPLISREQHRQTLESLLKQAGAQPLTIKFFSELARARRLPLAAEIERQFREKLMQKQGQITAEVVCAAALGKKQQQAIMKALSKVSGKDVRLEIKQDESILGGLIVKVGGKMLDNSLAGKLSRLQNAMKARISQI